MKKAQTTTIAIIVLLVIIVAMGILIFLNTLPNASTSENVVKEELTLNDIQFNAFWRTTNPTCSSIISVNQNLEKIGELSYTFSSSNNDNVFGTCNLYVDDKFINDFDLHTEISFTDNAYAGSYLANANHKVKVCCKEICKEVIVNRLCSD